MATAPGSLAMVQRFINTADLEAAADGLRTPEALRTWLRQNVREPGAVGESDLAVALTLREALRDLAEANNGGSPAPSALQVLNRVADRARLAPRFAAGGARLEPLAGGVDAALGELVAAVYEAMASGAWARLKACARHRCRWAFYDASRNRSGTWCSMRVCGNREKAQRFRRRAARA